MIHQTAEQAIEYAKKKLFHHGSVVKQKTWQSTKAPDNFWELLMHDLIFPLPWNVEEFTESCRPNLPWAEDHFQERISGIPHNPPPSAEYWPFNPKSSEFRKSEKYSHTYPERFWPIKQMGLRFTYGNFEDIIELLKYDDTTRQAFLPIWWPEDGSATRLSERVPCTLGYHFIIRDGQLHITYYMRSCDIIRHFRDDIYMAGRLVYYIIQHLEEEYIITPGLFKMVITSLHCFESEKGLLKLKKT